MNSKILLLAACALSLAFVSCKDDTKKAEPAKVKHVECSMKLDVFKTLDIADITITYIDETGASKTEAVTTPTWEKKLTITKFPVVFKPTILVKPKTNPVVMDKYELGCMSSISYTTIRTDGQQGAIYSHSTTPIMRFSGYLAASLPKFFEQFGNKNLSLGGQKLSLNADGTNITGE